MLSESLWMAGRRVLPFALSAVLAMLCTAVESRAQQGGGRGIEMLTNAAVVKLVRARFSDNTVLSIIGSRPSRFDLSPDALIVLKRSGVSEKVIRAMLQIGETQIAMSDDFADDDWGDAGGGVEELLGDSRAGSGRPRAAEGEVDIFGSSGGSRGRTRSRGANGVNDNDTQTLGSVSARIIRPPAETGGAAAPKLERTPTLTNESVVELVAAGFSEGTILRRIEQSPVEFDLSPPKIAELKRRRVAERVIEAMRAAMADDAPDARGDAAGATRGR